MHNNSLELTANTAPGTSPVALASSLYANRYLIVQLIRREVSSRYKGSVFGLAWSVFTPIFMLLVYSFVFSEIFRSRWGQGSVEPGKMQFALILFVGIIILSIFSEVLNRSPTLILSNANYVKKVIFPLEILPIVAIGVAVFHGVISFCVLLLAFLITNNGLHWTVILAPLILFPLIILITGLAWILASLGVFLRDVSQTIGSVTTVLMFLSPVFYPITAVPEQFRGLLMASPLTFVIEQSRNVLIWGKQPDWIGLAVYFAISMLIAWIGFAWFQKTRKGFADVI
jgi:lipopolysaccharide transport system permease protein